MALVVITVQDKPDGSVAVNLETEPPVVFGQAKFSPAQSLGAAALNAIHAQLPKPAPQIVLAGADELPH